MIEIQLVRHEAGQTIRTSWINSSAQVFKGGEVNPRLPQPVRERIDTASEIVLKTYLNSADTCFELMLVVDAIRRIDPEMPIALEMGYTPYARQDRVCNPGEANGIAVFADVINRLAFTKVTLLDPHSDVTPALIKRSVVRPLADVMRRDTYYGNMDFSEVYLVAPDAGAQKRVKALATELGAAGYICATKDRDLETMEITGTRFDAHVGNKRLLVVDDICDGGRTFIALAKAIREYEPLSLELWVTHGIFSYGTEVVTELFDRVTTTNSFQPTATGNTDGNGLVNPKMNWLAI